MAALYTFQLSAMQTYVIFYFLIYFDRVSGTLHGLLLFLISNSRALNFAVPFKMCQKPFVNNYILLPNSPKQLLTIPTINQCLFIDNDKDVSRLHGHNALR